MEVPAAKITIRSSYNVSALSFTPSELYEEIKKHIPTFKITYKPDFRQTIAESLPESVNDATARNDWGWASQYDLPKIVEEMLKLLKSLYPAKMP
jgi:nucleoside-diphosphate-sugar epimerase